MVIAPANTGRESNNYQPVINTLQTNKGSFSKLIPAALILIVVVIKFMDPIKEETPAICKLKIPKSTAAP
jgi:hypothetical protein